MAVHNKSKFFLLEKFQNFYTEVIRLKQQARVGVLAVAVAAGSEGNSTTSASVDQSAIEIWNAVAEYLDREKLQVARAGTSMMTDAYLELLYVMAAVADEVFVHLEWEGQQYWLDHLVEVRFFRSRIAGERIFRNIHSVLARQDPAAEELAAVYLTALALGFRGQYWGGDTTEIVRCRLDLLQYLARSNPKLIEDPKRFFPDAYRYTIQEGIAAQLPSPATWWYVAAGVVLVWLIISTIAWLALTGRIRNLEKQNAVSPSTRSAVVSSPRESAVTLSLREQTTRSEEGRLQLSQPPASQPTPFVLERDVPDLLHYQRDSGNLKLIANPEKTPLR